MNVGPKIPKDGLILYLDGYNTKSYQSDTNWYDLSGNDFDAQLINSPELIDGAINLDGVNNYVYWDNNPLVNPRTYEAWIKLDINQNVFTLSCSNFKVYHQTNYTWYFVSANGNRKIEWVFNTDWFNIVYSCDGVSDVCFINGIEQSVSDGAGLSSQNNLQLGWRTGSPVYMNGSIATTKVYNRMLTNEEIVRNYDAQKSRFGL